jgi:dCTP deaminase
MILTGPEICKRRDDGKIVIEPWNESRVNPNSYNLTLHPEIKTYSLDKVDIGDGLAVYGLDVNKKPMEFVRTIPEEGMVLMPGILYIARTNEYTETWGMVPMLDGRSSLGRLGLTIHITAGFGDVGFRGTWTLEMIVVHPLKIYPNMEICQISYHEAVGEKINYDGRYLGQIEATGSRMYFDTVKKAME